MTDNTGSVHFLAIYFSLYIMGADGHQGDSLPVHLVLGAVPFSGRGETLSAIPNAQSKVGPKGRRGRTLRL